MTLAECLELAIEAWKHCAVELLPSADGGHIYGMGKPIRVSESLSEFFELYLTDPNRINLV